MLQKYKMMGLAAAACTLLGVNATEAAVTLTFEQSGANVTASWSGTYLLPSQGGIDGGFPGAPGIMVTRDTYVASRFDIDELLVGVSFGGVSLASTLELRAGDYIGTTFGYNSSGVYFPDGATGLISPVGTATFKETTLAALGAAGLNNFLAYTGSNNTGESSKIYLHTETTAIPEPASLLSTAGLLAGGLLIRKRKGRGNPGN